MPGLNVPTAYTERHLPGLRLARGASRPAVTRIKRVQFYSDRPALNNGAAVFRWQFPDSVKRIRTAGDGLCGLHAIRGSLEAQAPHLIVPTIEELLAVLDNDDEDNRRIAESIDASKQLGDKEEPDSYMDNRSWFLQDHLAAIFHLWGRSRGLDVALGIWTFRRGYKVHDSDSTNPKTRIIWVFHDNQCHYTGLRAKRNHK
ncbi:hypothetical protein F5Y01DRAFT_328425 [Xylaria sp. FL0043]|nr:hypothetical protein F5Y01DRAFT_328425 [Xylaria sp. FL0043]